MFLPPITALLPQQAFEDLIARTGMRFFWKKSHACPCTYGGSIPGQAEPSCTNCHGLAWYWDTQVGPINSLITFRHLAPSPDEPGILTDPKYGNVQHAEPTLTIPFNAESALPTSTLALGTIWSQTSLMDAFVQVDSPIRYQTTLVVGSIQAIPYQQGFSVAATGAVTTYNTATSAVVMVTGYTVSGGSVFMPNGTPPGTGYTVEFFSNPTFFVFRKAGGMPHVRPPGQGQTNIPRAFHVQPLDVFMRSRTGTGSFGA